MDQTAKPLLIPPQFALYAEKYKIFELYQRLLKTLVINMPADPLSHMIDFLKKDANASSVIIIGPPSSGKKSLAKLLSKGTGTILLDQDNLIESAPLSLQKEFGKDLNKNVLNPEQWSKLIKTRVSEHDCVRRGWVLTDFPNTKDQAISLLSNGIMPKHTVVLQAPDSVLIERAAGKRVDENTGEIYHTTFDWPNDNMIQQRLKTPENNTEQDLINRLVVYHRHIEGVQTCLQATLKAINVDQPKGDVFNQILDYVSRPARSHAPTTPRIMLIGPYGSGRRTQANALAKKYDIVNVSMSLLLKEAVAHQSLLGVAIKPHLMKKSKIPDSLILQVLKEKLGSLECVTKGWVLHGFPKTREQAEALDAASFTPNKVFFMDIPNDSIMERTTLRYLDPITGERYHMLFNPPPTQEVQERLHQKPSDSEDNIRGRITEYYATVRYINDYYEACGLHVNADQDPNTVFESIESGVVNAVPQKLEEA